MYVIRNTDLYNVPSTMYEVGNTDLYKVPSTRYQVQCNLQLKFGFKMNERN